MWRYLNAASIKITSYMCDPLNFRRWSKSTLEYFSSVLIFFSGTLHYCGTDAISADDLFVFVVAYLLRRWRGVGAVM
jgi:hypothetical protein